MVVVATGIFEFVEHRKFGYQTDAFIFHILHNLTDLVGADESLTLVR